MGRRNLWISLGLLALAAAGCEVTPEKIATWKGTQKGPDKLREAVRSASLKPELRGMALAALVEIGMVSEAEEELKASAEAERPEIVHAAVPLLVKLAQGDGPVDRTTRVQRNGKDALYQFRGYANAADRAAADDALIAWTTWDLAGRMNEGGHASDKILTAIGARAGPRLGEVIADARTSDGSRMAAATLLGKIGDRAARDRAGVALVERARKEKTLQDATLMQIGLVGGDHAVVYLTHLAEDGHLGEATRRKALLALAQGKPADAAALPAALRLAGDGKAPGEVRDAAFELAESIGAPAVPGVVKLIGDKDEKVRWEAVETALKAGGPDAVAPVLEALSPSLTYPKDDLRSFIVHDLQMLGPPALPALRNELKSKSWVARLAAAMAIAQLGKADDAPLVASLAGDGTKLKGWPNGATVGSEAKSLGEALAQKR